MRTSTTESHTDPNMLQLVDCFHRCLQLSCLRWMMLAQCDDIVTDNVRPNIELLLLWAVQLGLIPSVSHAEKRSTYS